MTIFSLAITILGWVGAAASIAAYYLVSSKRFAPNSGVGEWPSPRMRACGIVAYSGAGQGFIKACQGKVCKASFMEV